MTFRKRLENLSIFHLFILAGIVLAVIQYFYNRSLWLDEASLSVNIVSRDFAGLLKPLGNGQVAPIGFLFIERFFVSIIGKNEFALRLFPMLCFFASLPLMYNLARILTKSRSVAILAVAMFCVSPWIQYYSSEVKQYMTDAFFGLAVFNFVLTSEFKSVRSYIYLGALGVIALYCSNVSTIILFVSGLYLFYTQMILKRKFALCVPFAFWAAAFLAYYILFIAGHPTKGMMTDFWHESFMPLNPFSADFWKFLFRAFGIVFRYIFGIDRLWPLWLLPCAFALFSLFRVGIEKRWRLLFFLCAPVMTHLFISGLHLYPFHGRMSLYLTPLFILTLAFGISTVYEYIKKTRPGLPASVMVIVLVFMMTPYAVIYPVNREDTKSAITYMDARIQPGEKIYVYYGAWDPFDFYRKTGFVKNTNEAIVGDGIRNMNPVNYDQIDGMSGRMWFIFGHVYPFWEKVNNEEKGVIDYITQKKNGKILDSFAFEEGRVYHIDLGPAKTVK